MRVNIGCGKYPLDGYTNVDASQDSAADVRMDAFAFLATLADDSLEEVYAGHFLEHLTQLEGQAFLAECYRVLQPGGVCAIVVPDMRTILAEWLANTATVAEYPEGVYWPIRDLVAVCGLFLYGTCQESQHRWCYEGATLGRAMLRAGFVNLQPIDRENDPRLGAPAWFQGGWDGTKPQ